MDIDVAIVCVNYADFLNITLKRNIKIIPSIYVLTSGNDEDTIKYVEQTEAKLVITDAWYRDGAVFNKSLALNEWLDVRETESNNQWVLLLDADILLHEKSMEYIKDLDPHKLYSAKRRMCYSQLDWVRYKSGKKKWNDFEIEVHEVIDGKVWGHRPTANPAGMCGYFQMWNPGKSSGSKMLPQSTTAGGYDADFAMSFEDENRRYIDGLEVIHLGDPYTNWKGRVSRDWARDEKKILPHIEKINIDICIITYKNLKSLSRLLNSLRLLEIDNEWHVRFIVIDNDREQSAKETAEEFFLVSQHDFIYIVEPNTGIPTARNAALSHIDADYFCFIDDDAAVEPDWLGNLLGTIQHYNADAVFGRVKCIMPETKQEWPVNRRFNHQIDLKTGTNVAFGGAGNVIIKTASLGVPRQRFDLSYSLMRGEDTEFFHRMSLNGKKMVWCNEAVVNEYYEPHRLTLTWYALESFRNGQAIFRTFVKGTKNTMNMVYYLCGKGMNALFLFLLLPVFAIVDFSRFLSTLDKLCIAAGQIYAAIATNLSKDKYKKSYF